MKQKPYNILLMLHLPPPVHGSSIVGKLIKESLVINDNFHDRYINLILSQQVDESGKFKLMKIFRLITVWFRLLWEVIFHRPDLCYYALTTTGNGFKKDVLLILLLRLFRVKIVYHIHNKGVNDACKRRLNHLLYKYVFMNSSVILLSEHLYYDIKDYISQDRVFICPNGIEDIQTSSLNSNLLDKPFNILFLSNLIKDKGVFVLVDACAILNERGYDFQCDIVGGEGDVSSKQLNDYINRRGLTDKVTYHGKRYGEAKAESFKQANVFVLPSRYDCFPLVVLEAMQYSLPVITAREGGMPDMIEDGISGFLISPYNNEILLADRIVDLIRDPLLMVELGMNARLKYEQYFTLTVFEKRMKSILTHIIKTKRY